MRACVCIHTPCNHAVGCHGYASSGISDEGCTHLMHPKAIYLLRYLRQRDTQRTLGTPFSVSTHSPWWWLHPPIFIRTVRYRMTLTCRCVRLRAPCVSGPCVYTLEHFLSPPPLAISGKSGWSTLRHLPPPPLYDSHGQTKTQPGRHTGSVFKSPWPVQGVVRHLKRDRQEEAMMLC